MSAGPVLVPCPPVALGERSPVPGWGTIPACPLSNLSVFPQVTEQQPQGQWAQEHIRYPACRGQLCAAWPSSVQPGPAVCSLALRGSDRLHQLVTEASLQHVIPQELRARGREEEIHTSQG